MVTALFVLGSGKNWFDYSEGLPGFFNLVRESREKRPAPVAVDSQVLFGQLPLFLVESNTVQSLD